jgi:glycerate kinase
VTGEGRSDGQTILGKAPVGVAALGAELGVPTVCLSGSLGDGYEKLFGPLAAVMGAVPGPCGIQEALDNAAPWLEAAAERLGRLIALNVQGA